MTGLTSVVHERQRAAGNRYDDSDDNPCGGFIHGRPRFSRAWTHKIASGDSDLTASAWRTLRVKSDFSRRPVLISRRQEVAGLFDHFVGRGEQPGWYGEA